MKSMRPSSPSRPAMDFEKLVTSWIRYHEAAVRSTDQGANLNKHDDFWAFNAMVDLCRIDPETAWDVICNIIERVDDPAVLACVASGPLEDLLAKHGGDFIERVERAASNNDRFRETLVGVWQNEIPEDVWIRVEKARGT